MTLVLMTIDQYRAIVKPLGRRFNVKTTKFAIMLIWTFSVLIALPFNFALRVVKRRDSQPVCTDAWPSDKFEQFYFLSLFVVQFVIPMTIIVCCYTLICGHLNSKTRLDHLTCTSTRQRSDRNKKVRPAILKLSFFKIFWFIFAIVGDLSNFVNLRLDHSQQVILWKRNGSSKLAFISSISNKDIEVTVIRTLNWLQMYCFVFWLIWP